MATANIGTIRGDPPPPVTFCDQEVFLPKGLKLMKLPWLSFSLPTHCLNGSRKTAR